MNEMIIGLQAHYTVPRTLFSEGQLWDFRNKKPKISNPISRYEGGLSNFRQVRRKSFKFLPRAYMTEQPLLWAGRLCIFYALVKTGIVRPRSGSADSQWIPHGLNSLILENSESHSIKDIKGAVSKWRATTKGTLKRSYRVPTKAEGQRLLGEISHLLSDDDTFIDAACHKGCQIRRENAHAQSVCCNNVRALFDELPTPHLVIELTPFPVGRLRDSDYLKAEKIEKTLRKQPSI